MSFEPVIEAAKEYIKELFASNAGGHDAGHSLRVYHNAMMLAELVRGEPVRPWGDAVRPAVYLSADAARSVNQPNCSTARQADLRQDCDRNIVALAALLHDADDHKLFDTEDNANARAFLDAQNVPQEMQDRICEAVNSVSFSRNRGRRPATVEGQIVQDADRLDAIGAVGIARTFAYGGEHGRSLDDSVAHFHEKLLLLKDEMNTDAAREIAERRHAFMEQYLAEFAEEGLQK